MKATILAAIVLAFSSSHALAVSLAVKLACKEDYFAHCSQHAVGTPGVRKCMRDVGPRLSTGCITALADAGMIKSKTVTAKYRTKTAVAEARPAKKPYATKSQSKKQYAKQQSTKKQLAKKQDAKQYAKKQSAKNQYAKKAYGKKKLYAKTQTAKTRLASKEKLKERYANKSPRKEYAKKDSRRARDDERHVAYARD